MKSYYRFYLSNDVIIDYDTDMVSLATAKRRANSQAKRQNAKCEYKGVVEYDDQYHTQSIATYVIIYKER